jgi:hypothetical protein
MADIKAEYGTSNQAITITLAGLNANTWRESTAIVNTTNLFMDALVGGKIMTGTSAPTDGSSIRFYTYGTVDGGTLYSGNATGTDAAYTPANDKNQLFYLGSIIVGTGTSDSYEFGPWSVRQSMGGIYLPEKWGIVVHNDIGQSLHSTAANHDINYQGVYADAA